MNLINITIIPLHRITELRHMRQKAVADYVTSRESIDRRP
jgi:uncharacterized protein (UPF0248 family)